MDVIMSCSECGNRQSTNKPFIKCVKCNRITFMMKKSEKSPLIKPKPLNLIQRMCFNREIISSKIPSFNELLFIDNMKNSEFKEAILMESIEKICSKFKHYTITKEESIVNVHGFELVVLHNRNLDIKLYQSMIIELIEGKRKTFVPINLDKMIKNEKNTREIYPKCDIMFDLENLVFFTFGHKRLSKIQHSLREFVDLMNKSIAEEASLIKPKENLAA